MISDRRGRRGGVATIALATLVSMLLASRASAVVTADDLLLVVNKQQPAGRRLAEEYAKLRHVPDGRIVEVDVRDADEIERPFYDRSIADVVRRELAARNMRERPACVVLFYGLPLRIREANRTLLEKAEVGNVLEPIERTLTERISAVATRVEATAARVAPDFTPATVTPGSEGLRQRLAAAERAIVGAMPGLADATSRETARADLLDARREIATLPPLPTVAATTRPAPQAELDALIARRDDAASRRRLREVVAAGNNAFQLLALVEVQKAFLTATDAQASVDSELSCAWLANYPLTKWIANPLHYASPAAALRGQMIRVARIDGPTEAIARRSFNNTLVAEQRGLEGDAVFDARGKHAAGAYGSYEFYDGTIRRAAELVRGIPRLPLILDDAEPLLPNGTSKRTALYCGWYKVRDYQPTVAMVPGGIAFHVASFEMISLHNPGEAAWCRGLMNDGADVTLGPVAEPYLVAFPPADEFFGLLLTGRTTLVEAYWATIPVTSWRMVLVGDPLYRPFARSPAIDAEKLSPSLRAVLDP